jgi:hypothetical protein
MRFFYWFWHHTDFFNISKRCAMDEKFAKSFANDWVEAWNAHDIARVLSHYTDDFEMSSPIIAQLLGESSGILGGKEAVGAYWRKALQVVPDLRFELISVLMGVRSVTLYYKGARDRLSAEVFDFNASGQIVKATAHYAI